MTSTRNFISAHKTIQIPTHTFSLQTLTTRNPANALAQLILPPLLLLLSTHALPRLLLLLLPARMHAVDALDMTSLDALLMAVVTKGIIAATGGAPGISTFPFHREPKQTSHRVRTLHSQELLHLALPRLPRQPFRQISSHLTIKLTLPLLRMYSLWTQQTLDHSHPW